MGGGQESCQTPQNETKLSIIIVSFNTKEITDNCLNSIYTATWRDTFEVIVVDNNSQDGSVEMIREKYPQVSLICNPDNKLFSIANNQGSAIAKGKYHLLLNSDTIVYDNNLQKMVDYFETQPNNVICIGPKVLNPDKSLQSSGAALAGYRERFINSLHINRVVPRLAALILPGLCVDPNKTRYCGWVLGACMMMRASEYMKIGGLNENIEFYGEEVEFGYRTHKLGYKTIYYPQAEIIHLGGQSAKKATPATDEVSIRRYAKQQKETVGFRKAARMSKLVVVCAYIKKAFHPDKEYFRKAIAYEKKVIQYLEDCDKGIRQV